MIENEINISDYAENSYLEYAMSVVKGRAIASVQDGCKPVHRRIIYSMYKLGITDAGLPTKSARITGDVIGKYHPHGDSAVYEAMVNMTQAFRIRYPIIEGVGNFGSRDGDGAAAARYTECKFYPMSNMMFDELNEDAVDMVQNYDGKETEPKFMPARMPFILLNNTEGIGVGMATTIPSHNMGEVAEAIIEVLESGKLDLKGLMRSIRGPDFPTGAEIISSQEEMEKIYSEGRGSFRMRAKYEVEHPGTKNWKLTFKELPYGVSIKQVLEEICALLNPESKAKKDAKGKPKLSVEQTRLKQLFMNLIGDYRDDSDKENPLRLVISPKSHKQNPEELAALLLSSTSLETNFSANFVMVGLDGRPRQKGLTEVIAEWIEFRLGTIERRCKFHIAKIAARLHVLEGRRIILDHIDEVMEIVKKSEDPKTDLMEKYALSEIQAQDVLELRLRQLGNLELRSIEKEHSEASAKKVELEKIVATDKSLKKQMAKELAADAKKYGDPRKTEIVEAKKTDSSLLHERSVKMAEEDITLAISEKGWAKTFKGRKEREAIAFKEGDAVAEAFYCRNTDSLCVFDVEGKAYNHPLSDLSKDGVPLQSLFQMASRPALACPINKEHKYFVIQDAGFGFITSGENLHTRMKAGKEMVRMAEGASLLQPLFFKSDESLDSMKVCLITSENKVLIYPLSEVSEIAKGKGITICGLSGDAKIKSAKLLREDSATFSAIGKKGTERFVLEGKDFASMIKGRSAKGSFLPIKEGKTAIVSFAEDEPASNAEGAENA